MTITIHIDDAQVVSALSRLSGRVEDMTPLMKQIGEALIDSTKQRFATSTAPDGSRWAPNSQTTIERYLGTRSARVFNKKDGRLSAYGVAAVLGKKPLIGETGRLRSEFSVEVSANQVAIGSGLIYSAVQQFGASQGAFGRNRRGSPIPWGTIPPRPFLGVSAQDRTTVIGLIEKYLTPSTPD